MTGFVLSVVINQPEAFDLLYQQQTTADGRRLIKNLLERYVLCPEWTRPLLSRTLIQVLRDFPRLVLKSWLTILHRPGELEHKFPIVRDRAVVNAFLQTVYPQSPINARYVETLLYRAYFLYSYPTPFELEDKTVACMLQNCAHPLEPETARLFLFLACDARLRPRLKLPRELTDARDGYAIRAEQIRVLLVEVTPMASDCIHIILEYILFDRV